MALSSENKAVNTPDPWQTGGLPLLNVAAICPKTKVLGPGVRAVIWVQGCPFHCAECIAPHWIPRRIERLATPQEIAAALLAEPTIVGLTFSGGEPMLQAAGLAEVIRLARQQKELSLICFTGFTWEELREQPPGPGVDMLLAQTDVLIDGQYVASENNNRGLRGSANQRVHFLSERLRHVDYDFEGRPRQAEIQISNGSALLAGVPPQGALQAFHEAIRKVKTNSKTDFEK